MKVNKLFVKKYYIPQKYVRVKIDPNEKYFIEKFEEIFRILNVVNELPWYISEDTFKKIKEYNDDIIETTRRNGRKNVL